MNPRRKNDILLKSIIEEFFADMLRFFSPDADSIFDFKRGVTFMDKELLEIMPETATVGGSRFVDMLAKVWLLSGEEEWVQVHIEVQGQHDPQFARRMFTYYYRTLDRYNVPITAFAIFTGAKSQQKSAQYNRDFMGTKLTYEYNTLQVFDWPEVDLLQMNNPFALVVLAAQKLVLSGKLSNEKLNEQRLTIAKALIESKRYDHVKMQRFLSFLKNFIYIHNKEVNSNFDKQINLLTEKFVPMDIYEAIDYINKIEREERIYGRIISNLIAEFDLSDDKIAAITGTSKETIQSIREELNQ